VNGLAGRCLARASWAVHSEMTRERSGVGHMGPRGTNRGALSVRVRGLRRKEKKGRGRRKLQRSLALLRWQQRSGFPRQKAGAGPGKQRELQLCQGRKTHQTGSASPGPRARARRLPSRFPPCRASFPVFPLRGARGTGRRYICSAWGPIRPTAHATGRPSRGAAGRRHRSAAATPSRLRGRIHGEVLIALRAFLFFSGPFPFCCPPRLHPR